MPLYMSQFSYTAEAWAALARSPEDRSEAVSQLVESVGGRLVSLYYSFGEYDGLIIIEAPDEKAAAAAVLTSVSVGHIRTIKTTTLLTVEDTLEALRKAGEITFRGAGQ